MAEVPAKRTTLAKTPDIERIRFGGTDRDEETVYFSELKRISFAL